MIVIHIGLPKTASTIILKTISSNSDIILIKDIYNQEIIDLMKKIEPDYLKLNINEQIKLVNDNTPVLQKSECNLKTIKKIKFKELDKNKTYFIKNPNFIYNLKIIFKFIKEKNVKLIWGTRNLLDLTYSLFYHWKNSKLNFKYNNNILELYNHKLKKYFDNLEFYYKKLSKYNTVLYNFDNLSNYSNISLIKELFEKLNIDINLNNQINSPIVINNHEDVFDLKSNILFDKINDNYKTIFDKIKITKLEKI